MSYDDYLDRAMDQKPDTEGSAARFSLPDSNLRKEGNVTVFENFQETLDALGREADHVMKYLQNELGTSASIDDRGRVRFTGEFKPRRVQRALTEYADAYVLCSECGLPDTKLVEGDSKLRCEACGATTPAGN
ncbi:translation initiation factor IF-2 subunit beta [Natronomonas sp. EA1]|uniref:translation initiation factor IF-2 subunit beta n=1 Tax=Natronomonas sp. EA1 TaxID=3421655 RepID=UPI003EBD9061